MGIFKTSPVVHPTTNLTQASQDLSETTYQAPSLCIARTWAHPCFTYVHNPSETTTLRHKQSRECQEASDTHIYILPTTHASLPYTTYHITRGHHPMYGGVMPSIDHT